MNPRKVTSKSTINRSINLSHFHLSFRHNNGAFISDFRIDMNQTKPHNPKQWKKPTRLLNLNLKSHRNKSSHEIHPKKRVHYFTRKKTLKSVSNYITKSCEKEEKSKNN